MSKYEQWRLTDHICKNCFGRILVRNAKSRNKRKLQSESENEMEKQQEPELIFRCADCRQRINSNDIEDICCCGLKLKDGTDLGVRCVLADDPDVPLQTEIVAKQIDNL